MSLSRLAYDLESVASPMLAAALLTIISFHSLFAGTVVGSLASAALVVTVALPKARPVAKRSSTTLMLLLIATAGNVAGSVVNWYLGRSIERFENKRWFPVRGDNLEKARRIYARYGRWALLFSWLPIIGDPITLIAGVMKERFWSFLAMVTLAKASRYLVICAITLGWVR